MREKLDWTAQAAFEDVRRRVCDVTVVDWHKLKVVSEHDCGSAELT